MIGMDPGGECKLCGKGSLPVPGLHHYRGVDPCLGLLPDVVQACCGHGGAGQPYVTIAPGNAPGTMIPALVGPHRSLRNEAALEFFRQHGVGPPCSEGECMSHPFPGGTLHRCDPDCITGGEYCPPATLPGT